MGPSLTEESRKQVRRRRIAAGLAVLALALAAAFWISEGTESERAKVVAVPQLRARILSGPPQPIVLARAQDVTLQLPIARSRVTAIGYYGVRNNDALPLEAEGRRANVSFLSRAFRRFFETSSSAKLHYFVIDEERMANAVSVGALPGTDVYAPLSGTVVAMSDRVVDGEREGSVLQIQPLGDAETIVVLRNIDPDPELAVGQNVSVNSTRLGFVREMSGVHDQPLSAFTNGQGDDVQLQIRRVTPDFGIS